MRIIRWIVFTLGLTAILYVGAFFVLCKIKYNGNALIYLWSDYYATQGGATQIKSNEWNEYASKYATWDVVVLGASRAERSYDPAIFDQNNLRIFNFGTSAQSIQNTSILVPYLLSGSSSIKEIWIDLYPASFKDDALESTSDLIQNIGFFQAPFELAFESRDFRSLNLLMKRYFNSQDSKSNELSDYKGRGYVSVHKKMPEKLASTLSNFKPYSHSDFSVGSRSLMALEGILETCAKHGVGCKFIISPMSVFGSEIELNRMKEAIAPILSKYGATCLDLSHLDSIQTALHFYDEKHLNAEGVKIFNDHLVKVIQQ
ncbi:MAG: hypothetical protein RL609_255 [Bacteroidota bacterium]|jgi:hypothetical protein